MLIGLHFYLFTRTSACVQLVVFTLPGLKVMKSSEDIFLLIQSLTSAEKRYFKVFSSMHVIGEQNNYVRLFDAINQMEVYDEEHLREIFSGEKFIEHLSSEKVHLIRLILRSLRTFRDGKNVARQLTTMLEEAEILTEKRLYRQAIKILRKAEKTARLYEDFPILLRILDLYRVHVHDMQNKNVKEQIREIVVETEDVLDRLHNKMSFQNLYDTVFAAARMNLTGGNPDMPTELEHHPLLADEQLARSFEAKLRFNTIHAICRQMQGDFSGNFVRRKRILELWGEYPHRIKEEPQRFIRASSNFVNSCLHLKRYGDFPAVIAKLHSLKSSTPHMEDELNQHIYYLELLYSLNTGHLDRGLALAPELGEWLEQHAGQLNKARELALYYNLAVIFLAAERYADSLPWLNAIINDGHSDSRKDIQSFTRLLLPVVLFELGNDDILESRYRSAQYYLAQRGNVSDFEQAVLGFLKKLPWITAQSELLEHCSRLKTYLESLLAHPQESRTLGLQELWYWLESKLTGKSLAVVMREHLRSGEPVQ